MRLANLAYYSREFAFLNLKLKLFRQHTGSAGSFFTLKQYKKPLSGLEPVTAALYFLLGILFAYIFKGYISGIFFAGAVEYIVAFGIAVFHIAES